MNDTRQLRPLPYTTSTDKQPPPRRNDMIAGYQVLCPAGVRMILARYGATGKSAEDLAIDTACNLTRLRETLQWMQERGSEVVQVGRDRWALAHLVGAE